MIDLIGLRAGYAAKDKAFALKYLNTLHMRQTIKDCCIDVPDNS